MASEVDFRRSRIFGTSTADFLSPLPRSRVGHSQKRGSKILGKAVGGSQFGSGSHGAQRVINAAVEVRSEFGVRRTKSQPTQPDVSKVRGVKFATESLSKLSRQQRLSKLSSQQLRTFNLADITKKRLASTQQNKSGELKKQLARTFPQPPSKTHHEKETIFDGRYAPCL